MTRDDDSGSGRRGFLREGAAMVAVALGTAGCLSNPWSPGNAPTDSGGPAGDADDMEGGDGPATDDGVTTAGDGDGTTAADGEGGIESGGETTESGRGTTESGEETAESDGTMTEPDGTTEDTTAPEDRDPDLVVEVAPDGFRYSPETFQISTGDTVHWEWKDSGHNVRVREKPDGSAWEGTPGSATDTYAEGYLHAYTFETAGEYEYYCAPHQSLGLEGSFSVR